MSKTAKDILQEIAEDKELDPEVRVSAANSLNNIERQEKYDALETAEVHPKEENLLEEKVEELERNLRLFMDHFGLEYEKTEENNSQEIF